MFADTKAGDNKLHPRRDRFKTQCKNAWMLSRDLRSEMKALINEGGRKKVRILEGVREGYPTGLICDLGSQWIIMYPSKEIHRLVPSLRHAMSGTRQA